MMLVDSKAIESRIFLKEKCQVIQRCPRDIPFQGEMCQSSLDQRISGPSLPVGLGLDGLVSFSAGQSWLGAELCWESCIAICVVFVNIGGS